MTFRPKLWLGVGAVALASSAVSALAHPAEQQDTTKSGSTVLSQVRGAGGEGGEGGEAGEGGARRARGFLPARPGKDRAAPLRAKPPAGERSRARKKRSPGGGEGGERGQRRSDNLQGGEAGEGGEAGVNSRYIFGFTDGADTERAGERELESDTIGRFGKRSGSFTSLQNKIEFEYGITNDLMIEVGSFLSYHRIRGVPDLDNRNNGALDGLSAEVKYRIFDRRTAPIGLAVSVEPEWRRHSETSGNREDAYAIEFKLYADKELVPNRLFVAGNLLFEPEAIRVHEFDPVTGQRRPWEHESTLGFSGAVVGAIANNVFLGAEVRYLRKYEGSFLDRLEGHAVYLGPTLSARVFGKAILQAAYSVQIAGKAADEPNSRLDLVSFERRQARLRVVYEF